MSRRISLAAQTILDLCNEAKAGSLTSLQVTPTTTVADLLLAWPEVIPVFLNRRMACVGCNMARFETLQDASRIYGINPEQFLAEINRVISQLGQVKLS